MREILFRGFSKNKNGTEKVFYNGKLYKGKWVEGCYFMAKDNKYNILHCISEIKGEQFFKIIPETVGQYIGLQDKNGNEIFKSDIVRVAGDWVGQVVFDCGAWGISILPSIDWDYLESQIKEITGCDNSPCFCYNDNFISFWELMWNYNVEDNWCDVVEVIGNIYDNPELLEVK